MNNSDLANLAAVIAVAVSDSKMGDVWIEAYGGGLLILPAKEGE